MTMSFLLLGIGADSVFDGGGQPFPPTLWGFGIERVGTQGASAVSIRYLPAAGPWM